MVVAVGAVYWIHSANVAAPGPTELEDGSVVVYTVPSSLNDDARAAYRLGLQELRSGNAARAELHFKNALKFSPNSHHVFQHVGLAQYLQLNLDEAERSFERAIRLNPVYAPGYVGLGSVAAHRKDYEAAAAERPIGASVRSNGADCVPFHGLRFVGLQR